MCRWLFWGAPRGYHDGKLRSEGGSEVIRASLWAARLGFGALSRVEDSWVASLVASRDSCHFVTTESWSQWNSYGFTKLSWSSEVRWLPLSVQYVRLLMERIAGKEVRHSDSFLDRRKKWWSLLDTAERCISLYSDKLTVKETKHILKKKKDVTNKQRVKQERQHHSPVPWR